MSTSNSTSGDALQRKSDCSKGSYTPLTANRDEVLDPEYGVVARVMWGDFTVACDRARLFAAAQELLAACEAYYYGQKENRECEAMMGAAIRKAKGLI